MCSWSCGQKDPDDVVDLPIISTSLVLLPGNMLPPSHCDHEKAVRARQSYIFCYIFNCHRHTRHHHHHHIYFYI